MEPDFSGRASDSFLRGDGQNPETKGGGISDDRGERHAQAVVARREARRHVVRR